MIRAEEITRWHDKATEYWHRLPNQRAEHRPETLDLLGLGRPDELLRRVLVNHDLNFRLWHEEDLARDPEANDAVIAAVKRRIDVLNQQRNDAVESIDQGLADDLAAYGIVPQAGAAVTTETAGAAIDRLSILALRLYHYDQRATALSETDSRGHKVAAALAVCRAQRQRLSAALDQVLAAIYDGTCRHDVFHQLKMYNDPELNPILSRRQRE